MPTVALAPTAGILYQAFTTGGLPLNAGLLYTYIAGGTTPQATYTTSAGNVQNANPIVLGADGRPPNEVWLIASATYRFDLKTSAGTLIASYDNVPGISSAAAMAASGGSALIGFDPGFSGDETRTVQAKLRDIVSLTDAAGIDPTGNTSSTAGIAAAVAACAAVGAILWVPAGNYLHATDGGSITLQEVNIMGPGTTDYANQTDAGAVFSITGTTNVPFKIRNGVTIGGCNFYYPAQVDTATPVVYPVLFDCDFTGGSVSGVWLHDNVVFNAYKVMNIDNGSSGSVGHMWIEDNEFYGINRGIYLRYNAEIIRVCGNDFSFGVFSDATEGGLAGYTRANGVIFECDQTDGVIFDGNVGFGYHDGWKCASSHTVTGSVLTNNIFDNVLKAVTISGTTMWVGNQVEGNVFACVNNQDFTQIGNAVTLTSTVACALDMGANYYSITTGDHITISGTGAHVVSVNGGKAESMGYQQASGTYAFLKVNAASANVSVSVPRIIGRGVAYTSGIIATSCTTIEAQNSRFTSCFNAVRVDSATTIILTGNRSDVTGDTVADLIVAPNSATTLVESSNGAPLNVWDKPSTHASGKSIANNGATGTYTIPIWASWSYIGTSASVLATTLPAGAQAIDGHRVTFVVSADVGTATWVSTGATFVGAPAALTANTPITFIYSHVDTHWYRA